MNRKRPFRETPLGPCARSEEGRLFSQAIKIAGVENYSRKTCGCGQPRGHLIQVLHERSVNDGGDFCLLTVVGDSQISLI